MTGSDLTRELLQRLARLTPPPTARVVSVYLDLNPSENFALPRARRSAITALIDEARREAEAERSLPHDARMALRADIDRVSELLEQHVLDGELVKGARALAVFACRPAALMEAVRLAHPLRSRVAIARRPLIAPLTEVGLPRRWAVLLSDGDDARLLEGEGERLAEVERFSDELRRRAGRGVWAPERTHAPLPEDELAHVRRVVELVAERARQRRYERIAVGTDERIWHEIRRRLPGDVRDRVVGHFAVDADEASITEVRARVEPLLRAAEQEARKAAIERLGERGACGFDAALGALHERRAGTLLLHSGLGRPGWICPRCGRATTTSGPCPLDAAPTEPDPDIVDWAVSRAIDQDAEILTFAEGLERCAGIAVLLRF